MAGLPETSCLTVRIDGRPVYRNRSDVPLVPASTQKLLTSAAALDVLGADHRFTTRVRASAAPVDGVVAGDLFLVGGGDPLLATNVARFIRSIGDDQHPTSLDELADRVAAAGIRRITGRVVGDESRYDQERVVASWPARYAGQGQSGPLSALTVDDGYHYELPPDEDPIRRHDERPALSAAGTFTTLLQQRGIEIGAFPAEGTAPASAPEITHIRSAPLRSILAELLTFSDNQTAELLTKEIGFRDGGAGSTAAGVTAIGSRASALGFSAPGGVVVDGSGLDPANRATCDQLAVLLDASGPEGVIGQGLAIAGRTGTLRRRMDGPALAGRLRAKTGNLAGVSALAGFVPTAGGEVATFAMVTNGQPDSNLVWQAQTAVGEAVAAHRPVCDPSPAVPIVVPGALHAASMGTVAGFPVQALMVAGSTLPVTLITDEPRSLLGRCLASDDAFGVVLLTHLAPSGGDG